MHAIAQWAAACADRYQFPVIPHLLLTTDCLSTAEPARHLLNVTAPLCTGVGPRLVAVMKSVRRTGMAGAVTQPRPFPSQLLTTSVKVICSLTLEA